MIKINECNGAKIFNDYFEMYLEFCVNGISFCENEKIQFSEYMKNYNPLFEQIKRDVMNVEYPFFIRYDDYIEIYNISKNGNEILVETYYL